MNQLTWSSLWKIFFSSLKLFKNLDYLESVIIGWIELWNFTYFGTFWEDQNVSDSVLQRMYSSVVLQYICCVTQTWAEFLKPQFSSTRPDYIFCYFYFFFNIRCSRKLCWHLCMLIHSNCRLSRDGYLKKVSADWRFQLNTSFSFEMFSLMHQCVLNTCMKSVLPHML